MEKIHDRFTPACFLQASLLEAPLVLLKGLLQMVKGSHRRQLNLLKVSKGCFSGTSKIMGSTKIVLLLDKMGRGIRVEQGRVFSLSLAAKCNKAKG